MRKVSNSPVLMERSWVSGFWPDLVNRFRLFSAASAAANSDTWANAQLGSKMRNANHCSHLLLAHWSAFNHTGIEAI